jgi:hypothetical protein
MVLERGTNAHTLAPFARVALGTGYNRGEGNRRALLRRTLLCPKSKGVTRMLPLRDLFTSPMVGARLAGGGRGHTVRAVVPSRLRGRRDALRAAGAPRPHAGPFYTPDFSSIKSFTLTTFNVLGINFIVFHCKAHGVGRRCQQEAAPSQSLELQAARSARCVCGAHSRSPTARRRSNPQHTTCHSASVIKLTPEQPK